MKRAAACVLLPAAFLAISSCRPGEDGSATYQDTGVVITDNTSVRTTAVSSSSSNTSAIIETKDLPDKAGDGDVLFDIYENKAEADMDGDGSGELISLETGDGFSVIRINGIQTVIGIEEPAGRFALIDIDISDGVIELLLTDSYNGENDPSSYIFWWDGESLISSGTIRGLGFDGMFRASLDPGKWFDARGTIFMPVMADEFTEILYLGRFILSGEQRMLQEELYETEPLNDVRAVMLKEGYMCALLAERDPRYYTQENNVIWDYASWPHINGREVDPEPHGIFSVIAAGPELLTVKEVYGTHWIKLETEDGYEGWINMSDKMIKGYDKVMYIDIYDMFELE